MSPAQPEKKQGFLSRLGEETGITRKAPADPGTLARKVQQEVYATDPDFGNYNKEQRLNAIKKTLSSWNLNFSLYEPEQQNAAAEQLLKAMGEEATYGAAEGVYDVAVPALGGAVGSLGGIPGVAAGAGTAAMTGEAAKAEFERSRRGIPTQAGQAAGALGEGDIKGAMQYAYDLLAEHADTGAFEALSQLLMNPLGHLLMQGVRKTARPIAQRLMVPSAEHIPEPVSVAQDVLGEVGRTMTAGQLNSAEKGFCYFLEGVSSGGMCGGPLKRTYRDNFNVVQGMYRDLMQRMSSIMEPSEWGRMVKSAYDGELGLVKVIRNDFWRAANEGLAELSKKAQAEVDIGPLIDWFAEEAGQKGRRDVLRLMVGVNDFLGLKGLSEFKPGTDIAQMTYLIQKEIQGAPRKLTPLQASYLLQRMNDLWGAESMRGAAEHGGDLVRDQLVSTLREMATADPKLGRGVLDDYLRANKFHRETAVRLQDGLLPSMMKTLKNKPSSMVSFVHSGQGSPYDNLMALKKLYKSERELVPRMHPKTGKPLTPASGRAGVGVGGNYETDILQPLRYNIMQNAYMTQGVEPHFSGDALMEELKRLGMKLDPERGLQPGEFLDEVFTNAKTGDKYFQEILKFGNALKGSSVTGSGDTVFIKFAQAGVGVQAMTGQAAPGLAQRAVMLFISPPLLAKILSNPTLLASTTKAIEAGPKTTPWSRALSTLNRVAIQAQQERRQASKEWQDFYKDMPTQPAQLPWTFGLGGFR